MRHLITVSSSASAPARPDVLDGLGIGEEDPVSARLDDLVTQAVEVFREAAEPAAIFEQISIDDFARVYDGAGWNAPASPLEQIYPRADVLALFAATLGAALDARIRMLFEEGNPALGYVLDVVASRAAERLALVAAERLLTMLPHAPAQLRVLPYSPGYCGWHVSGQRALFDRLQPADIGVHLTKRCLMSPLKSVSGVLVAAPASAHRFRPSYPFCDECTTHECRARMASIKS